MSHQESQGGATAAVEAGSQPLDPVEAMLRGRYAQESIARWVWKRVRDLYPK